MDWLQQVPIGQYVAGSSSWLRTIDPRMKFMWVAMFLLTPILAGPFWRLGIVFVLTLITFCSGLPLRVWWKSLFLLIILSFFVGGLATFLPASDIGAVISVRPANELSNIEIVSPPWEIVHFGPLKLGSINLGFLSINRRSAELGVNTSTLIFSVVQSVNLMLLTTAPDDLIWALRWFLSPFCLIGIPVDRISFQLLLSLRFLPLVQEELQNLLRSLVSRSVDFKKLGLKGAIALILSVGERLIANILLRAEQGADALLSRGGVWLPPSKFRAKNYLDHQSRWINILSGIILFFFLGLRRKYGYL